MSLADAPDGLPNSLLDGNRLHQFEVLRSGRPGAPMILMSAGWNGPFLYADLAALLPASFGIGLLIAYPYPGAEEAPVLDAVADRTTGFENLLAGDGIPFIRDRPLVLLGYSRGGLVSHELSVRLNSRGFQVALEVLIDTLFPGEERHRNEIVSLNRRAKYKAMAQSRQFAAIVQEVGKKATDRVRSRLQSATPRPTGPHIQRSRFDAEARPLTTADYSPPSVQHPCVFYRASATLGAWTTDRWREIIPILDEVVVEGRHIPPDSIMEAGRIDHIAVDLTRRLALPST